MLHTFRDLLGYAALARKQGLGGSARFDQALQTAALRSHGAPVIDLMRQRRARWPEGEQLLLNRALKIGKPGPLYVLRSICFTIADREAREELYAWTEGQIYGQPHPSEAWIDEVSDKALEEIRDWAGQDGWRERISTPALEWADRMLDGEFGTDRKEDASWTLGRMDNYQKEQPGPGRFSVGVSNG